MKEPDDIYIYVNINDLLDGLEILRRHFMQEIPVLRYWDAANKWADEHHEELDVLQCCCWDLKIFYDELTESRLTDWFKRGELLNKEN